MELQDWRKEPRKNYSNEFKLRMVELASQPGACVAQIARENGVNDNVIFKWLRLWQNEGRVSRRLPVTTSSDTGVELLPVEITPDEQKEPVAAIAPSLSTSTQTRVSASSCKVEFRHGNMTLENPSPELLTGKRLVRTVLIFTESSDQLSRATDRVPGLPASPGYVQ
ncbi:IS66-like element accessory protein TnpA [Escherichia coli]|uniref:IS66-like element accessory protein TnpA n=1 Tax=Escherichia coli TaxID=562 RepID=UPI002036BE16|nr:transposase [Escherichia coli]